eukprot:scaffold8617_cov76-Amphora_coffeaeformis.AAC.1
MMRCKRDNDSVMQALPRFLDPLAGVSSCCGSTLLGSSSGRFELLSQFRPIATTRTTSWRVSPR